MAQSNQDLLNEAYDKAKDFLVRAQTAEAEVERLKEASFGGAETVLEDFSDMADESLLSEVREFLIRAGETHLSVCLPLVRWIPTEPGMAKKHGSYRVLRMLAELQKRAGMWYEESLPKNQVSLAPPQEIMPVREWIGKCEAGVYTDDTGRGQLVADLTEQGFVLQNLQSVVFYLANWSLT